MLTTRSPLEDDQNKLQNEVTHLEVGEQQDERVSSSSSSSDSISNNSGSSSSSSSSASPNSLCSLQQYEILKVNI